MAQTDFIPQNPTAFVVWFTKFIMHLQSLSAKYELCSERVEALLKDHEWVHYWAWMRSPDAGEQEKHLLKFFNASAGAERASGGELPAPLWNSAGALAFLPDKALPGIKERISEIAECIKAQSEIYTKEDGALLGILTPEEAGWSEDDYTPDLKFKPLGNYDLEVNFRKFGMDAVRFEYRRLGGDWKAGGFIGKSPGVLKIPPRYRGAAEQVEIRAVFWCENRNYGDWSPVYRLMIAP